MKEPTIELRLRAVRKAREKADDAADELRRVILGAVEHGASHAAVAREAGLTRGRVSQIIGEERSK